MLDSVSIKIDIIITKIKIINIIFINFDNIYILKNVGISIKNSKSYNSKKTADMKKFIFKVISSLFNVKKPHSNVLFLILLFLLDKK